MTYEVDQILTVLPEEMEALNLARGEDYCTLVTCTPYGVNTHRLLVRGTRIENLPEEEQEVQEPVEVQTAQESGMSAVTAVLVVAVPLVLAVVIWLLFRRRSR